LVRRGRAIDVLIRRNVVTGATMAFRSAYTDLLLPIPRNQLHLHDGWIAFLLAAVSDVACLNQPLIEYRQRPHQVIGAHPPTGIRMLKNQAQMNSWRKNRAAHCDTLEWYDALQSRLLQKADKYPCDEQVFTALRGKVEHLQRRINMSRTLPGRTTFVARELLAFGYHRYSIGVWAAAKDLAP
jgi:hypothetical protein